MADQPIESAGAPQAPGDEAAALALQHSPLPTLILDPAGHIVYSNLAAEHTLGDGQGRLVGQNFLALLDPGSRDKGQAMLREAEHGRSARYELNQWTASGRILLVDYQAMSGAGAGPPLLVFGQLLEAALAQTELQVALYRRLNAFYTIVAAASRSLRVSEQLGEALRVAIAELDLQAGAALLSRGLPELSAADLPRKARLGLLEVVAQQGLDDQIARKLTSQQWLAGFVQRASHRRDETLVVSCTAAELGLAPGDVRAAVGPLLSIVAIPLRGERGVLGRLLLLTDRYRAFQDQELEILRAVGDLLVGNVEHALLYESLLERDGQLQGVLNSVESGVLLVDHGDTIRYANARVGALLGTQQDWVGQPAARVRELLTPLEHAGSLPDAELWTAPGPQRRLLERHTEPVLDLGGVALGAVEIYSDVTQRHEMNQLKDDFIMGAAQGLKAPLAEIKRQVQGALAHVAGQEDAKLARQIEMVNARSDDLAVMMDSLLDLSRLQAGRLRLDLQPGTAQDVVGEVLRHFQFDLQRQGRSLEVVLPEQPIPVRWDRPRVARVLINLVGNALKYSPDGGPVEVRVRQEQEASGKAVVELAVTDHGMGIAPEERERIFERFYRVTAVVEAGFRGTGLGLYISQRLVAEHGGRMWAAEALHGEEGSTLYVLLPADAGQATAPAQEADEKETPGRTR